MKRNVKRNARNYLPLVTVISFGIILVGYICMLWVSMKYISTPINIKVLHSERGMIMNESKDMNKHKDIRKKKNPIKTLKNIPLKSKKKKSKHRYKKIPAYCKGMTQAFITAGTESMLKELTYLVKSVHLFSSHCIIVYMIDFPNNFILNDVSTKPFPRLIQRVSEYLTSDTIPMYAHAIIESKLERGVWLEPDSLVNHNVDELFKIFSDPALSYVDNKLSFPLFPIHTCIPEAMEFLMQKLNIPIQTMPYVQSTSPILFTHDSITFLQSFLSTQEKWDIEEEMAINIFLWKHKVTMHLTQVNPLMSQYKNYLSQSELKYIPDWWMALPGAEMWFVLFRTVPNDWTELVYKDLDNYRKYSFYKDGEWYSSPERSAIYPRGYRTRRQCICQSKNCQRLQIFSSFLDVE